MVASAGYGTHLHQFVARIGRLPGRAQGTGGHAINAVGRGIRKRIGVVLSRLRLRLKHVPDLLSDSYSSANSAAMRSQVSRIDIDQNGARIHRRTAGFAWWPGTPASWPVRYVPALSLRL